MNLDESTYIAQVAQLGESQEVRASEDIRAANGVKLLPRGAKIDRKALDSLLRHKLFKPIDQTTTVADAVDQATLLSVASELMGEDTEMAALLRSLRDSSFPQRVVRRLELLPMICNKLTVAQRLYEPLFLHSLDVMLVASLIGENLGCTESELGILATAGLTHDLGTLHIEAVRLGQSVELKTDDWRQIYVHSRIGALILAAFPQYRPDVARAVLEHHERMDGSGYPLGRHGTEIGGPGRILAFADFAVATTQKRGLRHMFTITKTHPDAFDREVVRVMARAMQQLAERLEPASPSLDTERLRELLARLAEVLEREPPQLSAEDSSSPGLTETIDLIRTTIERLRSMMHRAGFELTDIDSCLARLDGDAELQTELESLVREAHFRLRGLLLELRRRGHGETDRVAGLAALTPWIELAGIQVQRMYEVLPGSLDPTGA